MDYGIPLGRRFRCLKLWFSFKYFGVEFFKTTILTHIQYSKTIYDFMEESSDFEIMAPKPLSTVCFRALPKSVQDIDRFNQILMDAVNNTGKFFISHTKLNNKIVLRHVVSGFKTKAKHIDEFKSCLIKLKSSLDKKNL